LRYALRCIAKPLVGQMKPQKEGKAPLQGNPTLGSFDTDFA
jgi:hypothetical protein